MESRPIAMSLTSVGRALPEGGVLSSEVAINIDAAASRGGAVEVEACWFGEGSDIDTSGTILLVGGSFQRFKDRVIFL
jgi:hypothetical protein